MNHSAATFLKSQGASLAATVVEYSSILIWTEFFHQFYAFGVAIGAVNAAVTNFLINRHWSFKAAEVPVAKQGLKYSIVSAGSLCLNTGLVYLITENFHIHYMISVVFVGLMVGFLYNYPLQRFYVYRKPGDKSFGTVLKELRA